MTKQERKALWLARVSARARMAGPEAYAKIMEEASDKFDKENQDGK